ncbi:MAG: fasciclin domain-containing protein [Ilumatobacteraceae bacterium]
MNTTTTTTVTTKVPVRTSRRAKLGLPLLAGGVLFAGGWIEGVPRIERDLEHRVDASIAAAGFSSVHSRFSGQDGTLRCDAPLMAADRDRLVEVAEGRYGVRVIELDNSCGTGDSVPPDNVPDTTPVTEPDAVPVAPTIGDVAAVAAADGGFSTFAGLLAEADLTGALQGEGPFTVFAPTNAAFEQLDPNLLVAVQADPDLLARVLRHHVVDGSLPAADLDTGSLATLDGGTLAIVASGGKVTVDEAVVTRPDIPASNGVIHAIDQVLIPADVLAQLTTPAVGDALATFDGGQFTLTGTVANEAQRQQLVVAATSASSAANVIDQLVVDPAAKIADVDVAGVAQLIAATPPNLVSGRMGWKGTLFAGGVFRDDAARSAFDAVATSLGVSAELAARPDGAACDTAGVTEALNAVVTEQPVQFGSGSATISPASAATLDRIAAVSQRCSGIAISITGHTDSGGSEAANQVLSEQRAAAVMAALVERGLPSAALTSSGKGESQLVLVNGVEDKEKSRRVEFDVSAA